MLSEKPESEISRKFTIAVAAVTVFAFALRQIHSGDAIGGYHSFNEAWYSTIATNYTDFGSFLFPTTVYGAVDYNVSPFVSYLLYASVLLFGLKESALSLVPAVFSALTCPVIYALGTRLFNRRAGLASAVFYAFAPVSVIIGRNIQTDSVYVCLMLLSLLLYLKSGDGEKRSVPLMAAGGLLFGAAFLTKQFAGILLPAVVLWELARHRNLKWFGWGQVAFGLAALVIPGPFFFYHLAYNRDVLLGAQSALSASQYVTVTEDVIRYVIPEYFWGMSPPIFALAVVGLFYALVKNFYSGLLLLLAVAGFNWFFYHWHGHSYYILFAVPFLCIAAGSVIGGIKWRAPAALVTVAFAVFAAALSLAMLCTIKFGYREFRDLAEIMKMQDGSPVVVLTDAVAGSYYPAARFYGRKLDILKEDELARLGLDRVTFRRDRNLFIVGYGREDKDRLQKPGKAIIRDAFGLICFGYQLVAEMHSEHFFNVKKLYIMKNGRRSDFGIVRLGQYQSMSITYVSPLDGIPIVDGRIDFSGENKKRESEKTAEESGARP